MFSRMSQVPVHYVYQQNTRHRLYWGMLDRTRNFVKEALSQPIGGYAKGSGKPLPMFLVCTPEKLLDGESGLKEIFCDLHQRGLIARFVIDEAQCALNVCEALTPSLCI